VRKSKPGLSGSRQERIIGASQSAQNGRSLVAFSWKNEGTERLSIIRFPCLGGSATLSVTDRCRDGAVMEPGWNLSPAAAGQYCSLPQIKISYPQHNLSRSILIFQTKLLRHIQRSPLPPRASFANRQHLNLDRERLDPILGWELTGKGSRVDHMRLKLSRSCWKL
jgi:hypothetical protein